MKTDKTFIIRPCVSCKEEFGISKADAKWLAELGLTIEDMKYCKTCYRRRKRQ